MKHKKIADALNEISDKHITQAVKPRNKHTLRWVSAVAAILAVAVLATTLGTPRVRAAKIVSEASASRKMERPNINSDAWGQWRAESDARNQTTEAALDSLSAYFTDISKTFLSDTESNSVFSPVNSYIALAMLAETTGGETQSQILELLNAPDLDTLRKQVSAVWETAYQDDGKEISVLANSVWLEETMSYNQEVMDTLAYHYYATVYRGDLGSEAVDKDIQTWLNANTGGLLKDYAADIALDPETVLTLASTIYLKAQWSDEFSENNNTAGRFKTPGGSVTCTFMNKKEYETTYYWGDSYGAVQLSLRNGCRMWFFLPDEDKTVDDVLAEGQYLQSIWAPWSEDAEDHKYMKVNLSVPKFDISSEADLAAGLQELGITDVFDKTHSDFTPSINTTPVWVDTVKQAARVAIDEEGVVAASYIVIPGAGAGMPPDEIIDFVLDRPFLFVIESDGIPLFTGVVNEP